MAVFILQGNSMNQRIWLVAYGAMFLFYLTSGLKHACSLPELVGASAISAVFFVGPAQFGRLLWLHKKSRWLAWAVVIALYSVVFVLVQLLSLEGC